ncbi:MAG: alkaline phosphatase family protein [Chloroflexi bacterium]|nr:alkaline phosphatase family protein [Chloroflexota bacterium]
MTLSLPPSSVRPDYKNGNFAQLPELIQATLKHKPTPLLADHLNGKGDDIDTVIFILADAFGWSFFQRFADHPALEYFRRHGIVQKLTAQFPSTTTAHITTFATGVSVGQHGLFEWQYYEPVMDMMIVPLLFTFSGERQPELLRKTGIPAERIMPEHTYYQTLAAQGIHSTIFIPEAYLQTSYNRIMGRGAKSIGYHTLPEALVNLRTRVNHRGPTCYYLYHPHIDSICHRYGPDAPQTEAEIDAFLTLFARHFLQKLPDRKGKTLLLLSADHGQTYVDPAKTIYLNQIPEFSTLRPWLKTNRQGQLMAPGGSPRDMFLYVKEDALEEAQALLSKILKDRADVFRVKDLIDAGFFGAEPPSQTFLDRVGNLLILPREHETVWWYEKGRFEQKYYGHHGGLSADEMEIPLLASVF